VPITTAALPQPATPSRPPTRGLRFLNALALPSHAGASSLRSERGGRGGSDPGGCRSRTWDSLGGRKRQLGASGRTLWNKEGLAAQSNPQSLGVWSSWGGRVPRDRSTRTEKVPVQRAQTRCGRRPPSPGDLALPSVGPFGSDRGCVETATPPGLTWNSRRARLR
jgi:hypothetical protein